jgi:hypothetical protein
LTGYIFATYSHRVRYSFSGTWAILNDRKKSRSLPDYRIEPKPTLGWCKQNLGFITDEHQTNVALTRARKGLIVVGEF